MSFDTELRAWLLRDRGVSASIGSVWGAPARMGLTQKN
jgi:hypothetical protein